MEERCGGKSGGKERASEKLKGRSGKEVRKKLRVKVEE